MRKISTYIFLQFLVSCFGVAPEKTGLEGKLLPNFSIELIDEKSYFETNKISKGMPFAIFYFTPECPYCRAQTTEIVEDIKKLQGIQFYFVSSFPTPALKQYSEEYKLNRFSNIIIGRDTGALIANYFEIPGVPYIAIYGKDGRLNQSFVGKIYSKQIKAIADK